MKMTIDRITGEIIEASIEMHRDLGPGLLESVYEAILARMLELRGFRVRRQQAVRITYAGMRFKEAFRADLIVEDRVVVEVKAVSRLESVASRQLLTYLKLLGHPVGLVVNFGQRTLLAGVRRVVNDVAAEHESRVRINRPRRVAQVHPDIEDGRQC